MGTFAQTKTLASDNQFCFKCPIFGAEVELAGCMQLNQDWMRGKRSEIRRGCQALMQATKCPTYHIIQAMMREGDDPYHSDERRVGQLRPALLAKIAPIQVLDRTLDEYGVPAAERELIMASEKGRGDVPLEKIEVPKKRARKSADPVVEPSALETAATTGDMAAAINKAMEKTGMQDLASLTRTPAENFAAEVAQKAQERAASTPAVVDAPKAEPQPAASPGPGKPLSLLERARLSRMGAAS